MRIVMRFEAGNKFWYYLDTSDDDIKLCNISSQDGPKVPRQISINYQPVWE